MIGILKEQEAGTPVAELCRKHGMSDATFYTWKSKYGGLEVSEAKRLRALEAEKAKLKRLLADAMLDNAAFEGAARKKMVTPAAGREAVAHLRDGFALSERRTCHVVAADRSSVRYQRRRGDDDALRERLKALAEERRRVDYRRLGPAAAGKATRSTASGFYRLYKEERLMVRRRGGRKRAIGVRSPLPLPLRPNQRWSVDFVHDQMIDGRRLRILAVRLHPRMPGAGGRHLGLGHPGRSRARQDHRRAWLARRHRLGQWHRADLDRDAGLVGSAKGCMALHRPR